MGSFVGHIDESIFFILLAFWWMANMFPANIKSTFTKSEFKKRLSYPLPGKRAIPIEAIFKTLFPIAGLIGEICSEGLSLTDESGNFRKIAQMQHMSIYTIFIVHGIIDILMSYGVPLPEGMDYFSAAVCFFWYGMSFSFHAHMHGKAALEAAIHTLPIPIMYIISGSALAEMFLPHNFILGICRIFCLLVLGTWFTQSAFVLYLPTPWPGSNANPRWAPDDERNMHAIVASFGFHLILSFVIIIIAYSATFVYLKRANKLPYSFQPINGNLHTDKDYQHLNEAQEDDENM